jgi:hypothetical protein
VTDAELLAKKLALIESLVADLRRLARPTEIAHDLRKQRFVEHTLQIAIQAALDVASHIVSDLRLGEPRTNRESIRLSLVPQRNHRVYLRCPQRRKVASQQRRRREEQCHAAERQRIGGSHAKEQRLHGARQGQRTADPDH